MKTRNYKPPLNAKMQNPAPYVLSNLNWFHLETFILTFSNYFRLYLYYKIDRYKKNVMASINCMRFTLFILCSKVRERIQFQYRHKYVAKNKVVTIFCRELSK